jgi:hypothetical protein
MFAGAGEVLEDGAGRPVSFVDSLFVRHGRLIVADEALRDDGGSDFLVRKYQAR